MKNYSCSDRDIGKKVIELLSQIGGMLPDTPCGGKGSCGKCKMKLKGALSAPNDDEKRLLGADIDKGFRLVCCTVALGDFEYEAAEDGASGIETDFVLDTAVTSDKRGTVLAADIGTTTVALYKCDAKSGTVLAKTGFVNPQRKHGADVISRLVYAGEGGAGELEAEINSALLEGARELGAENAEYAVICANTVMEHLLCGEDTSTLARMPFTPATLFGAEYELSFCKRSYIAPCIAAYVGGDITLGALACSLDRVEELTLYIDIGTNGEIVLADRKRMLSCAAAAGPAFEGGNIECGMMAQDGAVCRVYNNAGKIAFDTISEDKPRGICGSGLIDAIAVLLELELMDETGMLEEERVYLCEDVYISRKDVRNLQSAKAAVAAGVRTLCYEMKCSVSDIKRVIISGGFGSHIDPDSARRIGLIPYGCDSGIEFAGNCAGKGAVMLAINEGLKTRAGEICRRMEYTELSGHKKFNEYYIDEMYFEE